jgi:hypothetical protein
MKDTLENKVQSVSYLIEQKCLLCNTQTGRLRGQSIFTHTFSNVTFSVLHILCSFSACCLLRRH